MKTNKSRPLILFILLSSLIFLNCKEPLYEHDIEFDTKTFYREWKAWEAQGIVDYSVNVRGIKPESYEIFIRILVKDNVIISREDLNNPDYAVGMEMATISETYQSLERAYKFLSAPSPYKYQEAESIKIVYNENFHYPESMEFNVAWDPYHKRHGPSSGYLSEFIPLTSETEE